jgi:hypothetical protein
MTAEDFFYQFIHSTGQHFNSKNKDYVFNIINFYLRDGDVENYLLECIIANHNFKYHKVNKNIKSYDW